MADFPRPDPRDQDFTRRMLIALALIGLTALLYVMSGLLLVAFASILFGVILSAMTNWLAGRTRIGRSSALTASLLLLILIVGGIVGLFGAQIVAQARDLGSQIPDGLAALRTSLSHSHFGQHVLEQMQSLDMASAGATVFQRAMNAVNSVAAVVADAVLVFFAGLYLAGQPELYRMGILSLIPRAHRPRGAQIMDALYEALRQWLVGQLVSMAVIGVLFAIALSIIGVPSALVLGLIAALAEFVPLIGPVIATIPAILAAVPMGGMPVLYVIGAFLLIQQTESNLLVPYIQRRTVHLAPVAGLFATVIFGLMFGIGGLLFAVPLTVAIMVLVRMIYVDDILGGPAEKADGTG